MFVEIFLKSGGHAASSGEDEDNTLDQIASQDDSPIQERMSFADKRNYFQRLSISEEGNANVVPVVGPKSEKEFPQEEESPILEEEPEPLLLTFPEKVQLFETKIESETKSILEEELLKKSSEAQGDTTVKTRRPSEPQSDSVTPKRPLESPSDPAKDISPEDIVYTSHPVPKLARAFDDVAKGLPFDRKLSIDSKDLSEEWKIVDSNLEQAQKETEILEKEVLELAEKVEEINVETKSLCEQQQPKTKPKDIHSDFIEERTESPFSKSPEAEMLQEEIIIQPESRLYVKSTGPGREDLELRTQKVPVEQFGRVLVRSPGVTTTTTWDEQSTQRDESPDHSFKPHDDTLGFSDSSSPLQKPDFFDDREKIASVIEPIQTLAHLSGTGDMTEFDAAIYESFTPEGAYTKKSPDLDSGDLSAKVQQHLKTQILDEELNLSIEENLPEVKILTEERLDPPFSAENRESKVIQQIKTEIFSQELEEDISCSSPETKGFPSPGILTETVGISKEIYSAQEQTEQVMWEASVEQEVTLHEEEVKEILPQSQAIIEHEEIEEETYYRETEKETDIEDTEGKSIITVKDYFQDPIGEETKISQIITSKARPIFEQISSEISDEDLVEREEVTSPQDFEGEQRVAFLARMADTAGCSKSSTSEEKNEKHRTAVEGSDDSLPRDYKSKLPKDDSQDFKKPEDGKELKKDTSSSTLSTGDEFKGTTKKSSKSKKDDKLTVKEFESYSSSGETESHYYSIDTPRGTPAASRPTSSEFDINVFGGAQSSEYDTAATSQEASGSYATAATSQETSYSTACSSISHSSRESAYSVDSESSGNLASIEMSSEASETLVPSAQEIDFDQDLDEPILEEDDGQKIHSDIMEPYDYNIPESLIRSGEEIPFMKPWEEGEDMPPWQPPSPEPHASSYYTDNIVLATATLKRPRKKHDLGKSADKADLGSSKIEKVIPASSILEAAEEASVSHDDEQQSFSESSATQSEQTWYASNVGGVSSGGGGQCFGIQATTNGASEQLTHGLSGESLTEIPPVYAQLNGPVEVDFVADYDNECAVSTGQAATEDGSLESTGFQDGSPLTLEGSWLGPEVPALDEGEESQSTDAKRQGEEGSESIASDQDVWDSQQGAEYTEGLPIETFNGEKSAEDEALAASQKEAESNLDESESTESVFKSEFSYQIHQAYKYDMGFERAEDIQEENLDVAGEILLENPEDAYQQGGAYTSSLHYEREREFDVGINYNDLYTHQEVDEEGLLEDTEIDRRLSPSAASLDDAHSTPSFDTMPSRRFLNNNKNGEHDDMSISSLQEFERLEAELASSGSKQSQSSGDSSAERIIPTKSGENDDASVNSSLNEFEKLETECLESEKVSHKESSEAEEGQESQDSEASQCTVKSEKRADDSDDSDDYDRRMSEIDEIIRQAQTNVEHFHEEEATPLTKSLKESFVKKLSSSDSTDSSIVDKTPPAKGTRKIIETEERIKPDIESSSPTLAQHIMVGRSISGQSMDSDSIARSSTSTVTQYDIESLKERDDDDIDDYDAFLSDSKSQELVEGISKSSESEEQLTMRKLETSLEFQDSSSSDKDFKIGDCMVSSTDSLDPTSSTATHATYQFETDSVMSSSLNSTQASGEEFTMVSSTETLEPESKLSYTHDSFIDQPSEQMMFPLDLDEKFKQYPFKSSPQEEFVDEEDYHEERTIDEGGNVIIKRTVTHKFISDPEEHMKVFSGPKADEQSKSYLASFSHLEPLNARDEFEETDSDGNVIHVTRQVTIQPAVQTFVSSGPGAKSQVEEFLKTNGKATEEPGPSKKSDLCTTTTSHIISSDSSTVITSSTIITGQGIEAMETSGTGDLGDDGFSGTRVRTTTTVSSDGQEHIVSSTTQLESSALQKSMEEILDQFMAEKQDDQI